LVDGAADLLGGGHPAGVGGRVGVGFDCQAADVAEQFGDVGEGRVGRVEVRLGRLRIDFRLGLQFDQPLQRLPALGGGGVFAGAIDAAARADLVLQPQDGQLVGVQLLDQPRLGQKGRGACRGDRIEAGHACALNRQ
jgi:hypothetical protein